MTGVNLNSTDHVSLSSSSSSLGDATTTYSTGNNLHTGHPREEEEEAADGRIISLISGAGLDLDAVGGAGSKANLLLQSSSSSAMPNRPAPEQLCDYSAPSETQKATRMRASAGRHGDGDGQQQRVTPAEPADHHAARPLGLSSRSHSRPYSLNGTSSPTVDSSYMSSPSTSAAVSRHNSTASRANSRAAQSSLPDTAASGAATTHGLVNGRSSAHHRMSLGYPLQSPATSTASSPNIDSSPASQFSSEVGVSRTASGTINKRGQTNGFSSPSSPRSRRKPVPSLNLYNPVLDESSTSPAPAGLSPRETRRNMSSGQGRNGLTARNATGSASGSAEGKPSPLLQPGSATSWKGVNGSGSAASSEPGTPGFMEDKDLFYQPPATSPSATPTTTIPPRRSPSLAKHGRAYPAASTSSPNGMRVQSDAAQTGHAAGDVGQDGHSEELQEGADSGRRGTFHNGLNIHIPPASAGEPEDITRSGSGGIVSNGTVEVASASAADATRRAAAATSGPSTPRTPRGVHHRDSPAYTPSPTNTSSPFPPGAEYLNRSLPALPANASKVSLGMFSILQSGPGGSANGSPTVDDTARYDRNHSVDSNMTGLTSIETPRDMGRSTTTLDMFSALESGPDGRKYSVPAVSATGNDEYGGAGSIPPLKAYSPSLQSVPINRSDSGNKLNGLSRKKSGRLGFFHSSKNRSISQPVILEDEEPNASGESLARQTTRKADGLSESDDEGFSVSRPPSKRKMWEAGQTYLRDEKGDMIKFADLFPVVNGDAEASVPSVTKAELKAQMEKAIKKGHASVSSLPSILHDAREGSSGNRSGPPTPTQAHMHGQAAGPGLRSYPSDVATPPSSSRPSTATNTTGRNSATITRTRQISGTSGGVSNGSPSPFAFNLASSAGSSSHVAASHTPSQQTHEVELRTDRPQPKVVVFFIRTFYCGQCQDYTLASIAHIDPEALKRHNIRLVIISNGNWRHIKPYRELFKCPFPIYVDASRKLYRHMGLTKSTINPGPFFGEKRAAYNQHSVPRQWMQSVTTAVKLPKRNPGNLFQLGGEFILSPGYECSFAHRMTNFSNHMEASDVFRIAGVDSPLLEDAEAVQLDEAQQVEAARLQQEMEDWRNKREATLENMARKKADRIGQPYIPPSQASRIMLGLDDPEELDMRALQDSDDEDEMERIHGNSHGNHVNGVHPADAAAVASGAAASAAHTSSTVRRASANGDGGVTPSAGGALATDQLESGDSSDAYHTPADTIEGGPSLRKDHTKLDVAVGAVSESGSAPHSALPLEQSEKSAVHAPELDAPFSDNIKQDVAPAREKGQAGPEPAAPLHDEPVQVKTRQVVEDDEDGLSLAEKYERLMQKYEALKVEHDRRSSVAI